MPGDDGSRDCSAAAANQGFLAFHYHSDLYQCPSSHQQLGKGEEEFPLNVSEVAGRHFDFR